MPGVSGRELAAQLALERPGMRVLYTTGYAETMAMAADVDRDVPLLAKPFLPNDLVRLVRERLDSPAPPRTSEHQRSAIAGHSRNFPMSHTEGVDEGARVMRLSSDHGLLGNRR